MLEKIKEKSIWDFLNHTDKPIVLYGMGNGADMIIDVLESLEIEYADIFASDGFVRGHSFHGKKVLTLSEIEEKYTDFIILLTFAVHDNKMLNYLKDLSEKHILLAPTVPIAGKGLFTIDYIKENEAEFDKAYELLYDEKSKETFVDILNFKTSGKIDYLFKCQSEKEEIYKSILELNEDETIVDLGAYDGDTIREFLSYTNNQYNYIFAFEPDEKNFKKLLTKTDELFNIACFNIGAWDKKETLYFQKKKGRNSHQSETGIPVEFDSVDNVIDYPISFIKMDIEGAESKALDGAKNTILKYLPKLYICAYHRNEDFFVLPQKIREFSKDYKIYLRHHPYIPAWESNFYAIIK